MSAGANLPCAVWETQSTTTHNRHTPHPPPIYGSLSSWGGRTMLDRNAVQEALNAGDGILRLEPCWVPRSFMIPGRRLKLHHDDLYAFGAHRGGINERWFSSTTKASNGPATLEDEGLSYVRVDGK